VGRQPAEQKGPSFQPIRVLHVTELEYPIRSVATGTVILEISVNPFAAVERIDVAHGIPQLAEEAERAVRKCKFQPAELNGEPVTTPMISSFTFRAPAWLAK
jgi:TonB family protein